MDGVALFALFHSLLRRRGLLESRLCRRGWTLSYEIMFYAIFALGLSFPRQIGLPAVGVTLGVVHHPRATSPERDLGIPSFTDRALVRAGYGISRTLALAGASRSQIGLQDQPEFWRGWATRLIRPIWSMALSSQRFSVFGR